jgi:hypothetical protein
MKPDEKTNDINIVDNKLFLTSDNILLGVKGDHAQVLGVKPGEAVDQMGAGEGI